MKHTQVAGGVVLNSMGQVLVTNRSNQSWSLPKGHVDDGESLREAAAREIWEETGVSRLTFIRDLGSYDRYRTSLDGGDDMSELKTIHLFLFKTDETELHPVDSEVHPEAVWVDRDRVADLLTHRKDKEFFAAITW